LEKTQRIFIIAAESVCPLCFMDFGLWFVLCLKYPSESAPDMIINLQNKATAERYRGTAERGNTNAKWRPGAYYLNGIEVPNDEEEVEKWLRKIQWHEGTTEL